MAVRNLHYACTNATGLKQLNFYDSFGQAAVVAEIRATGHTLNIGDSVTVTAGYSDENQAVVTDGIVVQITQARPDFDYKITVHDKLKRAVDNFLAPDDPDKPFMANNIKAEDLVEDLLENSGLTLTEKAVTIFTTGYPKSVPIKLVTAWDAIDNLARITGFLCFCDSAGAIRFTDRKPYVTASDTVSAHDFTVGASGDILEASYDKSAEKLLNRIVVYGAPGIHAVASAVSAYLPSGFYKSGVIAHDLIDSQQAADDTAAIGLTTFNRLTQSLSLQAKGKPSVRARSIVTVTEPFTGFTTSTKWLIYGSNHTLNRSGYSMQLTLIIG